MSDEHVEVEQEVQVAPELNEDGTPVVAEPEEKQEKTPEDLKNEALNEKFQARDERRQLQNERAEFERLKAAQTEESKGTRPDIPDLPETYEDNYSESLQKRETAIREAAEFDANARALQMLQDTTQQQQAAEYQRQQAEVAANYQAQGLKYGLTEQDMNQQALRAGSLGLTPDEIQYVMADDEGPLMVKLLSENLAEAEKFASQPIGLSRLISLKQKAASASEVKTTETPDPTSEVTSGGVQVDSLGPKGATFM